MRHAKKGVIAFAAVLATVAGIQQYAAAALPPAEHAPQIPPDAYVLQLAPLGAMSQLVSLGFLSQTATNNLPRLNNYLDPALFASYGDLRHPFDEPRAALDHSKRSTTEDSPRVSLTKIVRIKFEAPALAPMAHTFFCMKYQSECKVHKTVFRGGAIKLTAERWKELVRVNAEVNRAIIPESNNEGLAGEKWLISPKAGDCNDYAVTKRHELLARRWPARSLLLSEVVTSWGEHHLILVVRTNEGDFVADNLTGIIRSWSKAPYQWVRVQSPDNPLFWSTVTNTVVWAKITRLTGAES